MPDTEANRPGAPTELSRAAQAIGSLLSPQPEGQAEQEKPTDKANPELPLEADNAEPETDEVKPEPEAKAEGEGDSENQTETEGENVELADTAAGLAEQLGMTEEEFLDHLKLPIKVQGEEKQATLRELRSGHQMEADYRRKTSELAEKQRSFESEAKAIQQSREHYESVLKPLTQELDELVRVDDQKLMELLNSGDYYGYEQAKIQAEQRKLKSEAAKRELQRLQDEQQRDAQSNLKQAMETNERILFEAKPEWAKDIEKGRRELGQIRQYLKYNQVPAETADALYDANSLIIAEKAMKWDMLQKAKPEQLNKAKQAPKVFQRPGPVKPQEDPSRRVARESLNRLRRTGDYRDAAQAFKALKIV